MSKLHKHIKKYVTLVGDVLFSKIFTVTVIVILAITLCITMAEEVQAAPKKVKTTFNVNGGKALFDVTNHQGN